MPRTTFLNLLVLLLWLAAAAAAAAAPPPPPLHSTVILIATATTAAVWECNAGYFRTTAASDATCARCTDAAQRSACKVGWTIAACSRTMDTVCALCPSLPNGYVYYAEGLCYTTACGAGYSSSTGSSACAPCPKGSYCAAGAAKACGTNCTTPYQGCTSPMQCVQTTDDAYGLTLTYTFSPQVLAAAASLL